MNDRPAELSEIRGWGGARPSKDFVDQKSEEQ